MRCHVLPLGLTIKGHGEMLYDMNGIRPAKRRPGGWYDDALVTAKGEAVFAALDNAAISAFRKHGLLFSVRRDAGAEITGADYSYPVGPFDGFFTVPVEASLPIKLFGLSLLWRAAASSRSEFELVRLPDDVRAELGRFILEQRVPKHWEFPMILGIFNNQYEFADLTPMPVTMLGARFIRWCMDGVIVYVATRRRPVGAGGWRGMAVGFHSGKLVGPIVRYKGNRQYRTVEGIRQEHLSKFGVPEGTKGVDPTYPEFEFDDEGLRVRRRRAAD